MNLVMRSVGEEVNGLVLKCTKALVLTMLVHVYILSDDAEHYPPDFRHEPVMSGDL